MQRQNSKKKKSNYNNFKFEWRYLGKPTVKRELTLDELIAEWMIESKERLRDLLGD